jgi:vitamin B12/bleomycin/antimicrobial peptide transport system ATP-binding/permease protein
MLNFQQQRYEADFRFGLARLRENAEGVALYSGEGEELRGLRGRFANVMDNWWGIMQRAKLLNALVSGYSQVAIIFPIIVAAPRYFGGAMALGDLTRTAGAFGQVQTAMSWFVSSCASLATWRAEAERLATFQPAIVAARDKAIGAPVLQSVEGVDLCLRDLTVGLPGGKVLLERLTLSFHRGQSTVITGWSGSGESTLFRAIAGIWPFGAGVVERPAGRYLFLPPKALFSSGNAAARGCLSRSRVGGRNDRERADAGGTGNAYPALGRRGQLEPGAVQWRAATPRDRPCSFIAAGLAAPRRSNRLP